jgi:hypothetical protein
MRVLCPALVTLALAAPAHGAPTPAETKAYRDALKEGRALAAKKDPAAVAAFQRALAAVPDDPAALSELGLAQLAAKDLAGAEDSERKAAAGGADAVKAGALYNLAVVLRAKGDQPGAVDALKQSLAARPNPAVLRLLGKLDPKAAAAAAPEEHQLDGPYGSVYEFVHRTVDLAAQDGPCAGPDGDDIKRSPHPLPPYLDYQVVRIHCHDSDLGESDEDYVAVHLKNGWWFSGVGDLPRVIQNGETQEGAVVSFEARSAGGRPTILVHDDLKHDRVVKCEGDGCKPHENHWTERYEGAVDVDKAGRPSMTRAVRASHRGDLREP